MTKTINEETDLRLLGLLTYLTLNKDKNDFFCLGYRELSRRTGMSEKWVRNAVRKLENYKVLEVQYSAPASALLPAHKKSCNIFIHILFTSAKEDCYSASSSALPSAPNEDENKSTLRSSGNITNGEKAKETKSRRK